MFMRLKKVGNSLGIIFDKAYLKEAHLKPGDSVSLEMNGGSPLSPLLSS
jgi:antitoxin component of MazEF toxin-antitoxin module